MTDALAEFMLARIAEDEEVARTAIRQHEGVITKFRSGRPAGVDDLPGETAADWNGGSDWADDGHFRNALWAGDGLVTIAEMDDEYDGATPAHVVRWDPARVLAECEAKRRIVAAYKMSMELVEGHPDFVMATEVYLAHQEIVAYLAAVHREHPDYRSEWAP